MDNTDNQILVYGSDKVSDAAGENRKFILLRLVSDFIKYISIRSRQFFMFALAGVLSATEIVSDVKGWSVRRMYWGRSSFYRSFFHVLIFGITVLSLLVGISSRINIFQEDDSDGLVLASGVVGNVDVLYQAGTAETITASNPNEKNWPEYRHVVKRGETIESVANQYGVSEATIRWANNYYASDLRVDQVLTVPGLDGVLYTVKNGDTVESIVKKIKNANAFDIRELNELQPPNYGLREGQKIFIPNGVIIAEVKKKPVNRSGTYLNLNDGGIDVPSGTFINPLRGCPGYSYSRGLSAWHTGVDLAKKGGCWINASSPGVVEYAGWSSYGQGFNVKINHGNGFISYYYHGNGEFAVKSGDRVNAGQRIMYMGTTGNSTGVHLHFEMRYNGGVVNPERYVRLR